MNEKTEISESAVEELFQLAEEKRAATVNSKKFGPAWATIAEKLRNGGILTGEEQKRLEHEALRKIAYLKELKERGKESATIRLHLLEEAYRDSYGELRK